MSETIQLKVEGMTCMHCVAAVRKALAAVDGVEEVVDVFLEPGSATVRGDARTEELIAAVKQAGYTASV
ncbi:MAG: cation transporter [Thiogranum sp.]